MVMNCCPTTSASRRTNRVMQYPHPSPTLTAVFPLSTLLPHFLGAFSPMGQAWLYLRCCDGWAEVVANMPGERAPLVIDDLVNVRLPFLHVFCVPSVYICNRSVFPHKLLMLTLRPSRRMYFNPACVQHLNEICTQVTNEWENLQVDILSQTLKFSLPVHPHLNTTPD